MLFRSASHFAPDLLLPALQIYRTQFRPSDVLDRPYAMAGVGVFAADTNREARRLFTSVQQQFLNLRRGRPGPVPPPVESMDGLWSPAEQAQLERTFACAVVGDPDDVRRGLSAFVDRTGVDELIVTAQIYDHAARLRSFAITAQCLG